jgi:hypothetical protein
MTMSLTTRLVRLADHLGDLRLRLQEAARCEVAHAIADALADATRTLIAGRAAGPARTTSAYEPSAWDDPWSDTKEDWTEDEDEEAVAKKPFPYEAALASAVAVARWSLVRTGQPITALGLAATVAIVLLVARGRLKPLVDVASVAHELLGFPKRPL